MTDQPTRAKKQKTWDELTPKEKKTGITTLVILAIIIFGAIGSFTGGTKNTTTDPISSGSSVSTQDSETKKAEPVIAQKGIAGGMYKVGTDMQAGEYIIVGSGYLQISSDSSGSFESIVENDNYTNRTIILINNGQYVKFSGRAYTPAEAPKVDASSGMLPAGKYKVGVDLPAGEYKLTPSGSGYYGLSTSASESMDVLVSNDNFDTDIYLTVQDGQYLKLSRASIKLR